MKNQWRVKIFVMERTTGGAKCPTTKILALYRAKIPKMVKKSEKNFNF